MPQFIAPLIAPILGVSATSATAVIASNIIVYAATTAASMLIQMAMQPKQQQDPGTKLHAASGGAVNQSIIIGQKETAGSLIYAGSWGKVAKTPNAYYVRVFCLQDMPSSGFLSRCWTSDNKGTIDLDHVQMTDEETDYPPDGSGYTGTGQSMGHPITSLDHDGLHYAWVKFLDGSQTAADPYLMQAFGSIADRPWKSTMIGRGRTLMIVTQRWTDIEADEEKNVVAVLGGIPQYDWRKDSTNGGSGPQRWGTPSTYGTGGNPIVAAYNIMRGIYQGGEWLFGGKNWPARRFDHDTWTAAANACDDDIALAGGTEKRFRIGGEINLADDPLTVLDRIFAGCGARLVESGGVYKVYVGGIGASVYSFNDSDVILTEALTGKMFPTREEICNTITGTYCEPDNGGQMKAFRKRFKASYITEDGGETRSKDMVFDYVRSNTQAQRLALHALNDNRRFASKLIALPALARKLEPGDTVNWSSSDRFGYVNKKWIAGDVTFTRYGVVFLAIREADATDSDWSTSDQNAYTVGVYGDIRPDTQIIDLTATAHGVLNDAGTFKQPGIKITWPTDADMVDCQAIRWQVRPFGQEIIDRGRVEFDEGQALIKGGILRNGTYQVRARIIPFSGRKTDYCDWVTIVADNYGAITDDDTDDTKPNPPTLTGITPFIRTFESGESVLKLLAAWSSSSGLSSKGGYIIFVDDGDSVEKYPADDASTSTSFRIRSGVSIAVYVRAVNGLGKKSNASNVITATYSKKAVNTDAALGLTVTTGFRKNVLKWTKASQTDHKWTAVYRRTTSGPGAWALLDTVKGTRFIDDSITPGTAYDYKIKHVDTSDNEGPESSAATNNAAALIVDADTDATAPAAPSPPTVTQVDKDLNGDGVVDMALKLSAASLPSGAKSIVFRIDEYQSDGTTLIDTYYEYPKKLVKRYGPVVAGRVYKVSCAGVTFNRTEGAFSATTTFTPTARTAVTAPTTVVYIASSIGAPLAYQLQWDVSPDADYMWTEVFENLDTGGSVTPGPSTLASYAVIGTTTIRYYAGAIMTGFNLQVWVRHVTRSGAKSSWIYAGEHTPDRLGGDVIGPNAITNTHLASNSVDTAQLVGGSVTGSKIAAVNVVTSHLADSAVTSAKIADGAVGTLEIEDGAVTLAKINNTATLVANGASGLGVGGVGTIASLKNNSGSLINAGTNAAGSDLSYSDSTALSSGSSPSGTWQCMGRCSNGGVTSWLRVS